MCIWSREKACYSSVLDNITENWYCFKITKIYSLPTEFEETQRVQSYLCENTVLYLVRQDLSSQMNFYNNNW